MRSVTPTFILSSCRRILPYPLPPHATRVPLCDTRFTSSPFLNMILILDGRALLHYSQCLVLSAQCPPTDHCT